MITTIEIRHRYSGEVLFLLSCENNTIRRTVEEAVRQKKSLQGAYLQGVNLKDANLQWADLQDADLQDADLQGVNLDFSCLSFSCGSRKPKTDQRQRVQLAHHLLSWIRYADDATEGEKAIFNALREYANQFHRTDVEKFAPMKMNEQ